MATNNAGAKWLYNMFGAKEPLIQLGKFAAGSSVAIKQGQILELTGNTNTEWVPMDSDFDGDKNVAVAATELDTNDKAGYYPIIVARPGDVFEVPLAAAAAPAYGAKLYYSSSEAVTTTGTNELGRVATTDHYPEQGHVRSGNLIDAGTTVKTVSKIAMAFAPNVSFFRLCDIDNT